jgi:hypothetical protein
MLKSGDYLSNKSYTFFYEVPISFTNSREKCDSSLNAYSYLNTCVYHVHQEMTTVNGGCSVYLQFAAALSPLIKFI